MIEGSLLSTDRIRPEGRLVEEMRTVPCIQIGVSENFDQTKKGPLGAAVRQAIFNAAGELGERGSIYDLNKDFLVQVGTDYELPDDTVSLSMAFNPRDPSTRTQYILAAEAAVKRIVPDVVDVWPSFMNVEPEDWTGTWPSAEKTGTDPDLMAHPDEAAHLP